MKDELKLVQYLNWPLSPQLKMLCNTSDRNCYPLASAFCLVTQNRLLLMEKSHSLPLLECLMYPESHLIKLWKFIIYTHIEVTIVISSLSDIYRIKQIISIWNGYPSNGYSWLLQVSYLKDFTFTKLGVIFPLILDIEAFDLACLIYSQFSYINMYTSISFNKHLSLAFN